MEFNLNVKLKLNNFLSLLVTWILADGGGVGSTSKRSMIHFAVGLPFYCGIADAQEAPADRDSYSMNCVDLRHRPNKKKIKKNKKRMLKIHVIHTEGQRWPPGDNSLNIG